MTYSIPISDLPATERPRERMAAQRAGPRRVGEETTSVVSTTTQPLVSHRLHSGVQEPPHAQHPPSGQAQISPQRSSRNYQNQ
ncbi:MAG: hypothetical protein AAGA67_06550, partial [Cyanobacteria bacterium P01_F01_bin.153]